MTKTSLAEVNNGALRPKSGEIIAENRRISGVFPQITQMKHKEVVRKHLGVLFHDAKDKDATSKKTPGKGLLNFRSLKSV